MMDIRVEKLADLLVNYSVGVSAQVIMASA